MTLMHKWEASKNSLFKVYKATVTWGNRIKRGHKNMNHPCVLFLYPPQSITHFVLLNAHVCVCACLCLCVQLLPVNLWWFDGCVDRQSGREPAEEEAMSFNIPLSSPQYIHVGARHWHRKYGGWCYRLSPARTHTHWATCHFPFDFHTQVQSLKEVLHR